MSKQWCCLWDERQQFIDDTRARLQDTADNF